MEKKSVYILKYKNLREEEIKNRFSVKIKNSPQYLLWAEAKKYPNLMKAK